ncbi:MAG: putative DNA-binding domain-containing protein [Cellvibrionaceae bacterium]|nr:putative DNA-binding domain-containing protein [Cellvibrionaceae bacterium]
MKAATWQDDYTRSLFEGLSPALADTFTSTDRKQQQQRFAVYQNNVMHSLSQALADLYPVVKQLVGDDFFKAMAGVFIRQHPPKQAAMVFFGNDFPEFLRHFEHAQALPYLADMAELELARHRAYHAADRPSLDGAALRQLSPEVFEQSSVQLHPSVQLISSRFAVFTLWQAHQQTAAQPHAQEKITINEPEQVMVVRQNYALTLFAIDAGSYCFWQQLQAGNTIQQAAATATAQHCIDISQVITISIQEGLFYQLQAAQA